ncbi:MAG: hypothetical protein KFF73_14640 [Cyclobacteriaceae bacterium]|nr:hypothetical protein [Cyclobacteriaceae bacterium]
METDIKKILQRSLITVFSIILILILNAYLEYRYELLSEKTVRSRIINEYSMTDLKYAWDQYIPVSSNRVQEKMPNMKDDP